MPIKSVTEINEHDYISGIYTELCVNCICISIRQDI